MASRVYQCYHLNLHKGQTYGQGCKIQDHDLQSKGNLHRDVRVSFQSEEQIRGGNLPGDST